MEREYTDEVYNRLLNQIDEINMATISPLTDWFGDLFVKGKELIGLVNLDNIEAYQKEVLDSKNITKKKLKKIFTDIENVDERSSIRMRRVTTSQEEYFKKLNFLSKQLKPNLNICSAKSLRRGCELFNKNLSKYDKVISKDYNNVLHSQASNLGFKGIKKAIGGIVSGGVTIASMPASWVEALRVRGPKGLGEAFVSDTWSLINDVFDVGSGLAGAAGAGIVYSLGKNKWINSVGIDSGMEDMEKVIDGKGLTGALEADGGIPKPIVNMSKTMDSATELVGIKNKFRNLQKSPQVLKKEKTFKKLKKWSEFRKQKEIASTVKKIYKVASNGFDLFEGGDVKNVINNGIATGVTENIKIKGFNLKDVVTVDFQV